MMLTEWCLMFTNVWLVGPVFGLLRSGWFVLAYLLSTETLTSQQVYYHNDIMFSLCHCWCH